MTSQNKYILYDTSAYWVNKLNSLVIGQLEKEMNSMELTASQWTILIPLLGGKIKTPQRLAKHVGIDKSAVTRILGRLEKKGFIYKKRDPQNGRYCFIELTEKAKGIAPRLILASQKCDSRLFDSLSSEEKFMFKAIINKMLRNIEVSVYI